MGYTGADYTHQGWLTSDMKYVVVNDELDEGNNVNTKTHVFNVEDLDNPFYVGFHEGTTAAIDHNLYIKTVNGVELVFEANYRAGLQVLKINDLTSVNNLFTEVAYFDIYPGSNTNAFNGAWSNYPYFPSGTVIVSGIEQGLFVLRSPNDFGATSRIRKRTLSNNDQQQQEEKPRRSLQSCTVDETFESATGTGGWTTGGTCSTGTFVVGTPTLMVDQCITTQPGGDHTTIASGGSNGKALYSAPNSGLGTDDIDGGECNAVSPKYDVTVKSELSAWYFHGQRDTGGDPGPNGDYFHLELSLNNGAWNALVSNGDVTHRAVWTEVKAQIPADSSVRLRIRAADGTASGDLVEAGIDDISICATATCTDDAECSDLDDLCLAGKCNAGACEATPKAE